MTYGITPFTMTSSDFEVVMRAFRPLTNSIWWS